MCIHTYIHINELCIYTYNCFSSTQIDVYKNIYLLKVIKFVNKIYEKIRIFLNRQLYKKSTVLYNRKMYLTKLRT